MYYDIRELIKKMKAIAKIDSNIKLAKLFNVSYNTLNTWIKRNKFPQEVIFEFCKRFNCSLDYLIFNKEFKEEKKENEKKANGLLVFEYLGEYKELNISFNTLNLKKDIFFNGGYYLLKKDDIYFISQAFIDPFSKDVELLLNNKNKKISFSDFKNIVIGLLINLKKDKSYQHIIL